MIRFETHAGATVACVGGRYVLHEATSYVVIGPDAVHWDGIALPRMESGRHGLVLGLAVGRVRLTCTVGGATVDVEVEVVPASRKLHADLWMRMLVDIEEWLPAATIGAANVRHGGVGLVGVPAPFLAEALLPLVPTLLQATQMLCEGLRRRRTTVVEDLPLRASRAIRPETVRVISRHPQVADALRRGSLPRHATPLPLRALVDDLGHPANRYVAWALRRVAHRLRETGRRLVTHTPDHVEDVPWFRDRARLFERAADELRLVVDRSPLALVEPRPDATAAMGAIFDDPSYARVHDLCRRFLSPRFALASEEPPARTRPSYGIYEVWCLLALRNSLRALPGMQWTETGLAALLEQAGSGSGAKVTGRSATGELELSFNAVFASYHVERKRARWSLSSERRPDFVIAWRPANDSSSAKWVVLDAKYQAGRESLSGALQSLHVYRDALRWDGHGGSARGGLLLAPSAEDAEVYFDDAYLDAFGIGIKVARPHESLEPIVRWVMASLGI